MAIKNIIARGIGFSPGTIRYIVTHGFSIGEAIVITVPPWQTLRLQPENAIRNLTRENTMLRLPAETPSIRRRTDD